MGYFIMDGIYTEWHIFVRPIYDAPAGRQTTYTNEQEYTSPAGGGVRKDIERRFGVLPGCFRILRRESALRCMEDVVLVSEVYISLHNVLLRMRQSGTLDEEIIQE